MKKTILSVIFALVCLAGMAQVPNEMSYSVLLMDPATGQVLSSQTVPIQIELRKGGMTGTAVWSQSFSATTDNEGMCQLTLDFSTATKPIDWSAGDLYLALIVNGNDQGAAKMTSVPYALMAASVEGMITKEELVGTWQATTTSYKYTYEFKADGTGSYKSVWAPSPVSSILGDSDNKTYTFSWILSPTGLLAIVFDSSSDERSHDMMNIIKKSATEIYMGTDHCSLYTKQP